MAPRLRLIVIAALILVLAACAPPWAKHDYGASDFLSAIRRSGADVAVVGSVESSQLSVRGQAAQIDDARVEIYQYATIAAARADAKLISPDGLSASRPGGTVTLQTSDPVHWYMRGLVIVFYAGKDTSTTYLLDQVLGEQFAGAKV
jgi:hypothetical protein